MTISPFLSQNARLFLCRWSRMLRAKNSAAHQSFADARRDKHPAVIVGERPDSLDPTAGAASHPRVPRVGQELLARRLLLRRCKFIAIIWHLIHRDSQYFINKRL
jgi:hypothetical protein